MSKMEELAKILEGKNKQEKQRKQSIERDKETWLNVLYQLFANIKKWMAPLLERKLATIKDEAIIISDDGFFQRYTAPVLKIEGKGWNILFQPVGRYIVGAQGRVDIICGLKRVLLIIDNNEWQVAQKTNQGFEYKRFDAELFAQLTEDLLK